MSRMEMHCHLHLIAHIECTLVSTGVYHLCVCTAIGLCRKSLSAVQLSKSSKNPEFFLFGSGNRICRKSLSAVKLSKSSKNLECFLFGSGNRCQEWNNVQRRITQEAK